MDSCFSLNTQITHLVSHLVNVVLLIRIFKSYAEFWIYCPKNKIWRNDRFKWNKIYFIMMAKSVFSLSNADILYHIQLCLYNWDEWLITYQSHYWFTQYSIKIRRALDLLKNFILTVIDGVLRNIKLCFNHLIDYDKTWQ